MMITQRSPRADALHLTYVLQYYGCRKVLPRGTSKYEFLLYALVLE